MVSVYFLYVWFSILVYEPMTRFLFSNENFDFSLIDFFPVVVLFMYSNLHIMF